MEKEIKKYEQKDQEGKLIEVTSRVFDIMAFTTEKGAKVEYGKVSFVDENNETIFASIVVSDLNDELEKANEKFIKSGDKLRLVGTLKSRKAKDKNGELIIDKSGKQLYNYSLRYITEIEIVERAKKAEVKVTKK